MMLQRETKRRQNMDVFLSRRLFTVEEYHQMAQAGILHEDDRVELIAGEIVEMAPIGSKHAACVDRLNRLFSQRIGERAIVRVQNPLRLEEHSEPQPDLALLRPRPDFYARTHPGPEEVFLVIEVAETSVAYDQEVKVPLYARAGIPEVWLIDLQADRITRYHQPTPQGYRSVQQVDRSHRLAPLAFPELHLAVEEMLG